MFKCKVCSTNFKENKNLYQHMRKQHNIEPQLLGGKITCPLLCVDKFRKQQDLRNHLETFHAYSIEKEEQDFPDIEAFETWKKRLETTSGYAYRKSVSEKTLSKGKTKTHYICHRSGIFKSESTGLRRIKKLGSNRIGSTCPSAMEVQRSLSDGTVHVLFWKTHVGHEADIKRTPVPRKPRLKDSDSITYDVCVVIPAAGCGERMGLASPKQYIPIHDKPLICYTVEAFLRIPFIKKVVVVAAPKNLDLMLETLSQLSSLTEEKLMVTEGSGFRHRSIDAGLKAIQTCCESQPDIVIIHDGVRPFFSEQIVCNAVLAAKEHGAAGVICPLVSTVVSVDDEGFLDWSLDRSKFKASEMPQAFRFDVIRKAYDQCSDHDFEFGTECLQLAQKYSNVKAKLLPGTTNLWKVTHRKDVYTAAACVKESQAVGIVNFQSSEDLLLSLSTSLCKRFKSVHTVGKVNDSALNKFSNLVQFWNNKNISDVIEQFVVVYGAHKSTDLLTVIHILDSFDETLNFFEIQAQANNIAKELMPSKLLFYFILMQKSDCFEVFQEVGELAASLLFDSNPNISGSIFLR